MGCEEITEVKRGFHLIIDRLRNPPSVAVSDHDYKYESEPRSIYYIKFLNESVKAYFEELSVETKSVAEKTKSLKQSRLIWPKVGKMAPNWAHLELFQIQFLDIYFWRAKM